MPTQRDAAKKFRGQWIDEQLWTALKEVAAAEKEGNSSALVELFIEYGIDYYLRTGRLPTVGIIPK